MKMKACLILIGILFLATCSLFAQDKIRTVDISQDKAKQTIIAAGTPEIYQGHPYSCMFPDQKTIFLVWCINHGGFAGPMAKSVDGGKSWERIDSILPPGYKMHRNCPSIFRMIDEHGKDHLQVFSAQPLMPRIMSSDQGKHWIELEPLGIKNVMSFSSIVPKEPGVQNGKYLGFYHHVCTPDNQVLNMEPRTKGSRLRVLVCETDDAGLTWSEPRVIADLPDKKLCEPFAFLSPDKKEICCLMRENTHKGNSMMIFSKDRGATWSQPRETSWELTGDRHQGEYLPDGRLIIAFRDTAVKSPTYGHFVAWVGTYDDLTNARPGQYRIKLLHSFAKWDCGYPGVHVFDNGDVLALTYIKYEPDENKHSIISTRFNITETDKINSKKD